MDYFFSEVLGQKGVIAVIGLMIFMVAFRYSKTLFTWIEDRTYQKRENILKQFELLYIQIIPEHITYALLALSFGLGALIFILFSFLASWKVGLFLGLAATIFGWRIPEPIMNFALFRRRKAYQGQMVDALQLLSNGIRAGQSLAQAIAMVVDELPPPISQDFNYILAQNKIGVPLEECLEELVRRVPLEDNEMFVTSINILHETGGNLAETFDTIIEIIRERIRLQQKIDTYTAQSFFQGTTIACMPFVVGGIYFSTDPDSMAPLFNTSLGIFLLILVLTLVSIGYFFILKIARIQV